MVADVASTELADFSGLRITAMLRCWRLSMERRNIRKDWLIQPGVAELLQESGCVLVLFCDFLTGTHSTIKNKNINSLKS
jgi:hypothetical protein